MNLKESFASFGRKATSPTAFSWYGIAGVFATGALTFFATKKWLTWRNKKRAETIEQWMNESEKSDIRLDQFLKDQPIKDKLKEAAGTVLIFTPPFAAALLTSLSIYKGNNDAMKLVSNLTDANNMLASRLGRYKDFAAGAAVNEARHRKFENTLQTKDQRIYFSDDPNEVEDYGKVVHFYYEYTEEEFDSTIMNVLLAERELQKYFSLRGYAAVNELRALYGLDIGGWYSECGWDDEIGYRKGYLWIEFSHHRTILEDGSVCYVIRNVIEPSFAEEFEWIYDNED